jgi:hypothetical protein
MLRGPRAHVRANLVAYVALFFALSGTGAYASHLVVRSSDIVNGQVKAVDLRNGAVKNAKIGAGAVTGGKIAANAVTSGKIAPGAVGPSDLATVPHIRARQTTGQTFSNNTATMVELDFVESSGGGLTLVDDRLAVGTAGVYFIHGSIAWPSAGTGSRQAWLEHNDVIVGAATQEAGSAASSTAHGVSALLRLAGGDTIRLVGRQSSGGDLDTLAPGIAATTLSAFWIGP